MGKVSKALDKANQNKTSSGDVYSQSTELTHVFSQATALPPKKTNEPKPYTPSPHTPTPSSMEKHWDERLVISTEHYSSIAESFRK